MKINKILHIIICRISAYFNRHNAKHWNEYYDFGHHCLYYTIQQYTSTENLIHCIINFQIINLRLTIEINIGKGIDNEHLMQGIVNYSKDNKRERLVNPIFKYKVRYENKSTLNLFVDMIIKAISLYIDKEMQHKMNKIILY